LFPDSVENGEKLDAHMHTLEAENVQTGGRGNKVQGFKTGAGSLWETPAQEPKPSRKAIAEHL